MGQRNQSKAAWGFGASALALGVMLGWGSSASAQQAATQAASTDETIVVTGFRASLRSAVDTKRAASVMMDAINAEDIADFPDANLAESLQRLPGIALDRENGEGKQITVRGLGSDFTRVRLNGLEALSTTAGSDSGTSPNRSRGFDFNTFASDLFSSLQVRKTASASTDEGSLGATVDLITGRPLDYRGFRLALSAEDAYYVNGEFNNPRIAGLIANQWRNNTIGALFSFAYNNRDSAIDRYRRQPGQSDYVYRGATFTGSTGTQNRQGFSAPAGTACTGANGVVPGVTVNTFACDVMSGSDPAAYALVEPVRGQTLSGTTVTAAGPLARIPALANLEEQDLSQERLGLTAALQWKPNEHTRVAIDAVYSRFEQSSEVNQIQSVGLNRNNTNANFQSATAAALTEANKRGTYATCTEQTATPFRDAINCAGTGGTSGVLVPGMAFSTNPFNLEPYDYWNKAGSPGFPGAAAVNAQNGMYARGSFIGRPGVDVLASHLNAFGDADFLQLRNVDWRSATDASYQTTTFQQASLSVQHDFSDTLRLDLLYGQSRSDNQNDGQLVEFNRMDSPETFTYDERGNPDMPTLNYGFNLADPSQWSLVKGFSALRHFIRETDNRYEGGHVNFVWDVRDAITIEFGLTKRAYQFSTNQAQRLTNEVLNPSLQELGVTAGQLGQVYGFGTGLDVPAGTPTSFFAPNIQAFRDIIGFACNCVNQYGDWRVSYLSNPGNQFSVKEIDTSYFTQLDWDFDLFGHRTFGNLGVRVAETDVNGRGYTPSIGSGTSQGPRVIEAENQYWNTLPSLNVAYELTDDVLLRFGAAKVMARPQLLNLAPTLNSLTIPSAAGALGAVTLGNINLAPFKATNYDFSAEWYFAPGGLFSIAVFSKDVSNFPQTVSSEQTLQSLVGADDFAAILATQAVANQTWLTSGGPGGGPGIFAVRQFQNAPGGTIDGYEITLQGDLSFLPGFLSNFGTSLNFTHINSKLQYIIDPGTTPAQEATGVAHRPQLLAPGPFLGASPNQWNATVYYETDHWSARVSAAFRDEYVTNYPVAAGTCDPGFCDSPLVNDFLGSDSTMQIDGQATYNLNDRLTFSFEALNINNQTENRWAYQQSHFVSQYSSSGPQYFMGVRYKY